DRAVGQVEHRPDVEVDEVDDVATERRPTDDAIRQIPERAAQDEPERGGGERALVTEGGGDDGPRNQDRRGDEEPRGRPTEAEGAARVGRVPQVEHMGNDRDGGPTGEGVLRPELRHAVEPIGARRRGEQDGRRTAAAAHPYRRDRACASVMQRSTYG